ncbi:MAG TPA: isoprenylcysteine carboxylmethyltransferase family protein [Candidatus Acidoferrales bacterium]|nr:isoprenylcysteine carboxylmethyltransferase family protein [Candidatus Acidoferrales bacterium]
MDLNLTPSVIGYLALLLAVAVLRIFELGVSKRNQAAMAARGAAKVDKPNFRWVVLAHTGVLIGAAAEVVFLKRPFYPALAAAMVALFLASNLLRLWVVRAMGQLWNVQVVDSTKLGIVTSGPFRYVRHPNYAAVFVEMFSLPLIHTAWITAIAAPIAYAAAISQRIAVEERVLLADSEYRAAMAGKPRFLPGLF